jgi:maltose phosphorylase
MKEKAYEMYLRTARLDLDDYNNDTEDGCHITSMAGTWLAVVKGFGGMRVERAIPAEWREEAKKPAKESDKKWIVFSPMPKMDYQLQLNPYCPDNWQSLAFKIRFRGALLQVTTTQEDVTVQNFSAQPITLVIHGEEVTVTGESQQTVMKPVDA